MGILSWFKGENNKKVTPTKPDPKAQISSEVPGMNGAVEVSRPKLAAAAAAAAEDITVFEFGSVAASTDKVTVAGYCPVSDELEPCRWEILPATGDNAPQFRVVF